MPKTPRLWLSPMRNIVSPLDGIRSPFGRRLGAAPLAAPVNVTAPAISGTPTEGSLLTASTGVWSGNPTPTYAYQWNRGGVAISGQTASSYTVVSADIGQSITVTVTATNSQGSASATSAAVTGQAAASAPVNTVAPAISGSPVEGSTITSSTGTWTGNPTPTYTYQWRRGGSPIGGATSASYTVVSADVGQSITVTVTATNVAGSASATSAAVTGQAAAVAPTNSVAPAISGSPTVGSTLTSSTGTWAGTPTPTYTYQWNRAGSPISGQTASTYTVVSADIGQNITVTVTATNTAGSASATSAAVVGQAASSFSPSSLFAASEPGGWYDPSDFSTMFQDIYGTIPVTAVGQPVGLIRDKSRTINRANRVSNGTFTTDTAGWTAVDGSIAVVSGELEVTGSGGSYPRAQQTYNLVVGKTYRISVTARRGTASGDAYIAHTSGALYAQTSSTTNVTLSYTFTATTVSHTATAGIFAPSVTGTAYFDNFVVEEISPADAFQATPGARPLLQQEAGGQYYLAFDGTDDSLVTAAINLTSTAKMTVFAGVRKLSDAATGVIAELSSVFSSNNGSFALLASSNTAGTVGDFYRFGSRGTGAGTVSALQALASGYAAPVTNIMTATGDIAGNLSTIRVNTTAGTDGTGSQGTGNYGNYPLYIGRRSGTTLPFNGRLYSLIVLGRAVTAGEITDTETWVNSKTGAY